MYTDESFFVQGVHESLRRDLRDSSPVSKSKSKLESSQFLTTVDLICEGPIEGLVDKKGNLLNFFDSKSINNSNIVLGKGLYYNDVPLIDTSTKKFNYLSSSFNIDYGDEFSSIASFPSTTFNYSHRMYLNENNYQLPIVSDAVIGDNKHPYFVGSIGWDGTYILSTTTFSHVSAESQGSEENYFRNDVRAIVTSQFENNEPTFVEKALLQPKQDCSPFTHKIRNKYCDFLRINIGVDSLYSLDSDGNTNPNVLQLVIELSETGSANKLFSIVVVKGISKGGTYMVSVPYSLKLNFSSGREYSVSIYPLTKKIDPKNTKISSNFLVHSIVESITGKGYFSYPFSAKVSSTVSSDHFTKDPNRSFDLKLKKVDVPSNYDAETRECSGNWNGVFDSFLRWTDNPAWIFNDICTNSRYGLGNGFINEKDLNKWDLYKIAKYCDDLIKTNSVQKHTPDDFFTPETRLNSGNNNIIYIKKESQDGRRRTLSEMVNLYPAVAKREAVDYFGRGIEDCIIYLYDIYNSDEDFINNNFRKIIWNIREGYLDDNDDFQEVEVNGDVFRLDLINDFGVERKLEQHPGENLMNWVRQEVIKEDDKSKDLKDRLADSCLNAQNVVKRKILEYYLNNYNQGQDSEYIRSIVALDLIFDEETRRLKDGKLEQIFGKCIAKHSDCENFLEPRFSANVLIDDEVECLKVLNDLASVFRGMAYYKNNFITATVDVNKEPVYCFNNTNVKDGLFSYSSGSLDGNYSVAKVLYKDQNDIFNDAVEIVEDPFLISQYGISVKEILGFGITTKGQAKRVGEWMLATSRFENQTVTFTTDIQGLTLKPSDVIQIQDDKGAYLNFQGRVSEVNYDEGYVVVDRNINVRLTDYYIKFLVSADNINYNNTSSSSELYEKSGGYVVFKIDKIENNSNKVYINKSENFELFPAVSAGTSFSVLTDFSYSNLENYYKIISIAEEDVNQYSFFCIKHDPLKYQKIDSSPDLIEQNYNSSVSFSEFKTMREIDISSLNSFYEIKIYTSSDINQVNHDAFISESSSSSEKYEQSNFGSLVIDFSSFVDQIKSSSTSNKSFSYINDVLNQGGGFICRLLFKNQSIKFKVDLNNLSSRSVFLGRLENQGDSSKPSSFLNLKFFLYNKDNQIVEV